MISFVIIISCQKSIKTSNADTTSIAEFRVVAPIPLNLADGKQKSDFQNYLKITVDFLRDSTYTYLFRGYNLSSLSDNDKTQIANNMVKDNYFMNKLNEYRGVLTYLENRYRVSAFTKEQWKNVIKLGMDSGIYFLPGLKEKVRKMEEKAIALMQNKKGTTTTSVYCCVCSDRVDQANADLAVEVAGLSRFCMELFEFPIAAGICYAGVFAFYLVENNRINSTEYWCDCMIENYGVCVY